MQSSRRIVQKKLKKWLEMESLTKIFQNELQYNQKHILFLNNKGIRG